MSDKSKIKNRLIIVLVLIIILVGLAFLHFLLSANFPKNGQNNEKVNREKPTIIHNSNGENRLLKDIVNQVGNHADNIDRTIAILSHIILIITLLIALTIGYLEWTSKRDYKDFTKEIKDENSRFQKNIQGQIDEIEERIVLKATTDIFQRVRLHADSFERTMNERANNFLYRLSERLELEAAPIEKRLMKAERLRNDIWDLLFKKLRKALKGGNWDEYLEGWNDFHKLNEALSQILSKEPDDICSGLGTFISLYPDKLVPDSLWDFVLLLKKQNRLNEKVTSIAKKLGDVMERRLDEKPKA